MEVDQPLLSVSLRDEIVVPPQQQAERRKKRSGVYVLYSESKSRSSPLVSSLFIEYLSPLSLSLSLTRALARGTHAYAREERERETEK